MGDGAGGGLDVEFPGESGLPSDDAPWALPCTSDAGIAGMQMLVSFAADAPVESQGTVTLQGEAVQILEPQTLTFVYRPAAE